MNALDWDWLPFMTQLRTHAELGGTAIRHSYDGGITS